MDRAELLGNEKIYKLLIKFSIPTIIGMLVNALYNIVDRVFIGHGVGSLAIAGITIGFPVMIIGMAFAMLIGFGATSLISIRLGEQRQKDAELIVGNAVILLVAIPLVVSIIGLIFLEPLLLALGASPDVLPYAVAYLRIILYGNVLMAIGMGMNNFIKAEGNPKIAMLTMLLGAITNVILDYVFIFIFNWGVEGAAYATIISQAVSAVWVLAYFYTGKSLIKIKRENFRLQLPTVLEIVTIGSAPFAMQLASSLLNALFNTSLSKYGGDIAIASLGIINSITMLIFMPIFGINQGAQPIIGFNYGAKQYERVKETLKLAIIAATVVINIGYLAVRFFPAQLIAMFDPNNPELIAFGAHAIKIFTVMFPIIGFQIVGASYFQAVGKPKHAMFLSLSRQVLILSPLILILPRYYGLNGVLYAAPISDLASTILTGIWLFIELKKLDTATAGQLAVKPQFE